MRKRLLLFVLAVLVLVGCQSSQSSGNSIHVVTREEGSGTRGAFVDLFGVVLDGVDLIWDRAEVSNSTSVMITTIAGNVNAIGYISMGSLSDSVKALKINGVEATTDNVRAGTYEISRPFNMVYLDGLNELGGDFLEFILSDNGQKVVDESGYIGNFSGDEYTNSGVSGNLVVAGSSSVTPVVEALKEAYIEINPDANIEIQQSDSSAGVTAVLDGIADIGMVSREVRDSELEKGLLGPIVIALDGIAVIVNNDNPVDNATREQISGVYKGEITDWNLIG